MSATLASAPPKASAAAASPSHGTAQPLGNAPGLPRISALAAQALNRAYAWPTPLAFATAHGQYELRWQADAQPASPGHVYAFRFGPAEGCFVLDSIGEHALIGDAGSDAVPAEIRCALIADALAPLIDALEMRTRQKIEFGVAPAGAAPREELARAHDALRFCVRRPGSEWYCHGALRFAEERYLGLACPSDPPPPTLRETDFDTLPITLRFTVGSTMLSVAELRSIARGDIIGIERWQSFGSALRCVATTSDGHVTVSAKAIGSRIVIDHIEENSVTPSTRADATSAGAPGPLDTHAAGTAAGATGEAALTHVDALEVRVSFELDERSMPLAQLKALKSGYVIELEQPLNQSTVHIRANGALVGQGHLVAVGNKLGVRVSRFSENGDE
ncbi:type III secretion system cytoplasmic ring protein SctQ [Trinickia diaoshuihuensis]|uniref:type III secretion system cytoplasmic ring protein SctQ n=1 Tax=Trinickia diaoshuihuensis TaxID=2292265 RepID=UPI000E2771A2|nr:type III secretion system cytoplasmic ring protein SctQ [Trinickia diaoshuihuensis]